MKKKVIAIVLVLIRCLFGNVLMAQSVDPVSLVVAKVIKAIDLKVQQLQNETIWLQQAQQVAEHALSKARLEEIRSWGQKQEVLYAGYFKELSAVRPVVKALPQVKQILDLQKQVEREYNRSPRGASFTVQYDLVLQRSKDFLQLLQGLVTEGGFKMKDAERVIEILSLREQMSGCLDKMRALNMQSDRSAAGQAQLQTDLKTLKLLNGKL